MNNKRIWRLIDHLDRHAEIGETLFKAAVFIVKQLNVATSRIIFIESQYSHLFMTQVQCVETFQYSITPIFLWQLFSLNLVNECLNTNFFLFFTFAVLLKLNSRVTRKNRIWFYIEKGIKKRLNQNEVRTVIPNVYRIACVRKHSHISSQWTSGIRKINRFWFFGPNVLQR